MQYSMIAMTGMLAAASAAVIPAKTIEARDVISVTPHDQYASAIGVLGCKVNTDRVAYFPSDPGCGKCVRVTANGRSVTLLHIDHSGGAYDISYDAWNYLNVGQSATANPTMGGGIPATYESVPMSDGECTNLLKHSGGKLAFSAANSMNTVSACLSDSWFAANYAIYNIANPQACTLGYDEVCNINKYGVSLPECPHQLGANPKLTTQPVYNIAYGTGLVTAALQ